MWAALIGLAAAVVKTFAISAASAAGVELVEVMSERFERPQAEQLASDLAPGADRETQLEAQRALLEALRSDDDFRRQLRQILEREDPEALAVGREVETRLQDQQDAADDVVAGRKPVSDLLDPLFLWGWAPFPLSEQQVAFVRSGDDWPTGSRCPVGGEELGFAPELNGRLRYRDGAGRDSFPRSFQEGFAPDPNNPPTGWRSRPPQCSPCAPAAIAGPFSHRRVARPYGG